MIFIIQIATVGKGQVLQISQIRIHIFGIKLLYIKYILNSLLHSFRYIICLIETDCSVEVNYLSSCFLSTNYLAASFFLNLLDILKLTTEYENISLKMIYFIMIHKYP